MQLYFAGEPIMRNFTKKFLFLSTIALMMIQPVFAANNELDIINIDEVGSNNRIKFAYPGIEYRIVIAAYGGMYPFTWELLQSPTGMTIDEDTGEITWANPSIEDTGCTVQVKVTDSESLTDTESYTITVTSSTDRFLFVSTSDDGSPTGTISDPYGSLDDFWKSNQANKIVYLRGGTHTYPHNGSNSDRTIHRVNLESTNPIAFLGYPGETVYMDGEYGEADQYCWRMDNEDHYFQNIIFTNIYYYGIAIVGGSDHATFYNCIFQNTYSDADSHNQSSINTMSGDHNNLVVFGCTFDSHQSGSNYSAIECYDVNYSVIQNNVFGSTGTRGLFFKSNSDHVLVRHNQFFGMTTSYGGIQIYGSLSGAGQSNIEISFNLFKEDVHGIYIYAKNPDPPDVIRIFRNTFVGTDLVLHSNNEGTVYGSTAVYIENNILQNSLSDSSGYGDFNNGHIAFSEIEEAEYNNIDNNRSDNLTGTSGAVDEDGLLVNRGYVGTFGWETEDGMSIETPTDFRVISSYP
jgi:hypothetical protein